MDRQTTEITLPESGIKVTLYSMITGGDFRRIQKKVLESVKIDLSGPSDREDLSKLLKDVPATIAYDEEDLTLSLILRSVHDKEGNEILNKDECIYNLSIPDNDCLYGEVRKISQSSSLSAESKKK